MVFDTNSSYFKKNQKMSWCMIFAVSCGYLARDTCACAALYHSSTDLLPWQKLVLKSNLALTSFTWSLQKSLYLAQIVLKLHSSVGKHQETHWSIPKSLPKAIFFTFLWLRKHCKFTIKNIFTLQLPLQEPVIQATIDCAIHLGTFYIRYKHNWDKLCLTCRWLKTWVL